MSLNCSHQRALSPRFHVSVENHSRMILTGENRRTRRKSCPSATFSTTNPTWTAPTRSRFSAVRGRRLTAWDMTRPNLKQLLTLSRKVRHSTSFCFSSIQSTSLHIISLTMRYILIITLPFMSMSGQWPIPLKFSNQIVVRSISRFSFRSHNHNVNSDKKLLVVNPAPVGNAINYIIVSIPRSLLEVYDQRKCNA
jgi:hypothetical protein